MIPVAVHLYCFASVAGRRTVLEWITAHCSFRGIKGGSLNARLLFISCTFKVLLMHRYIPFNQPVFFPLLSEKCIDVIFTQCLCNTWQGMHGLRSQKRKVYFWYIVFGSTKDTFATCVLKGFLLLFSTWVLVLYFDIFSVLFSWLFLDLTPGANVVLRSEYMVWGFLLKLAAVALGFASESNAQAVLLSLKRNIANQ